MGSARILCKYIQACKYVSSLFQTQDLSCLKNHSWGKHIYISGTMKKIFHESSYRMESIKM